MSESLDQIIVQVPAPIYTGGDNFTDEDRLYLASFINSQHYKAFERACDIIAGNLRTRAMRHMSMGQEETLRRLCFAADGIDQLRAHIKIQGHVKPKKNRKKKVDNSAGV